MKRLIALGLLAVMLAALAFAAHAQLAYAAKDVHLRAGPARDYPVVAIVPAGSELSVVGCLSDYSWCDVIVGMDRGWVYAGNIGYAYQGGYVPLLNYGAEIGIAVIGFVLLDYWNGFYADRPFYRDRDRWVHRPRPPRPVGPTAPMPVPPPRGAPGSPRPHPPPHGAPGSQHPQPPHAGAPGGHPPRPPQQGAPGGPRPRPPQQPGPGPRPPGH